MGSRRIDKIHPERSEQGRMLLGLQILSPPIDI
jgi:hypothetical protein